MESIRSALKNKGIKPKGGRYSSTVTLPEPSSLKLISANLSIATLGDLQLTISNNTPVVTYKGQTISGITYFDQNEKDNGKKKVGACRFVFQAADAKSGIQIILNNPDELFK